MLLCSLEIYNPFSKYFKSLVSVDRPLTTNTALSFDVCVDASELLVIGIDWTRRCSHAGVAVSFALFGLSVSMEWYDTRHWNYEKHRFYLPGEYKGDFGDD